MNASAKTADRAASIFANAAFIDLEREKAALGKNPGPLYIEFVNTKNGQVTHTYRLQPATNELAALESYINAQAYGEDETDYIMKGAAGYFYILSPRKIVRVVRRA